MAFLRSFSTQPQQPAFIDKKGFYIPTQSSQLATAAPYKSGWDIERGIKNALDRVTWVYKSVYAIASNAASLPIGLRKGDWRIGELTWDDPVLNILNRKANPGQDAFTFRFMLSSQLLLSSKGAFVEVIRNRMGDVAALILLQPQYVYPIPDPEKFVSGFSVEYPNTPKRIIPSEDVLWVRVPHPIDPFRGQTPLDSAGLAIEFDYYSKVYNRNFVVNDGRPGGILVVNGDLEEQESEELKRRFTGTTGTNIGGAGRLTVMSADSAQFIDTATNQRDAQYTEARSQNKEEILIAFGVPESVIGNAGNKTFANADTELEVFWRETMMPHLTLLERAFDKLDTDTTTYFSYDVSSVAILSRDDRERSSFHLEELKQGAISIDEYRLLTNREPVGIDELLVPTNLSPVVMQTNKNPGGNAEEPNQQPSGDGSLLNPNQRPGRRPNDAQDEAMPSGVGMAPASTSYIERQNPPTPRPIYTPPLTPLGQEIDESKGLEDSAIRRVNQLTRLEKSISLQVGSLFKRQERVVLEKASSKKVKEKWESGEGIKASEIFDINVWDKQIVEDGKAWISAVFLDAAIEISGAKIDSLDMDSAGEFIAPRVNAIKVINQTTMKNIEKIILDNSLKTHAEFVAELKEWFTSVFEKRVKTISRTEVGGAFNAGLLWAAKQLGYTQKTWVHLNTDGSRSDHADMASTSIGIDEAFEVSGKSVMHPGDTDGDAASNFNCHCTLLFS